MLNPLMDSTVPAVCSSVSEIIDHPPQDLVGTLLMSHGNEMRTRCCWIAFAVALRACSQCQVEGRIESTGTVVLNLVP